MSVMAKDEIINDLQKRLSDKLTVKGLEDVVDALKDSMNQYDIERVYSDSGTKFKDLLDAFVSAKRVEGRSEKTIDRYTYALVKLNEHLCTPVDNITVFHLREYFKDMKEKGWSERTMEGVRSIFCSFFGWCHRENLLKNNPTTNLGAIKYKKVIRLPFSHVDIEMMKIGCKGNLRDLCVVHLLYCSGIRVNELCQLNIENVDFDNKEVIVLGKGNKERTVFLDEMTTMLLKKYIEGRDDQYQALIVGKGTDRIQTATVRQLLKKIEKEVGLSNVHPHRFRRTFATGLLNKGMPIQEVANILGHENINTTMTYVHINKESVKGNYSKYFGNV